MNIQSKNHKQSMALIVLLGISFTGLGCLYTWNPGCPVMQTDSHQTVNCPDGSGHSAVCKSNDPEPKVTTTSYAGAVGHESANPVGYICNYVCQYMDGGGWSFCGNTTSYFDDGYVLDPTSPSCPNSGSGSGGNSGSGN